MRQQRVSFLSFVGLILMPLRASSVHATDSLPYSLRTRPYSGFNTGALGDTRTVGMGGATVGLADTFLAATSNPAGLAMTLHILDTNLTKNEIHDGNLQNYDQTVSMKGSAGIAVNINPWGFSLGIIPIGREGQEYLLPATGNSIFSGQSAKVLTEAHELRLGVARNFFKRRLSVGASLNIGVSEEEISLSQLGQIDDSQHSTTLGATLGMMYRLKDNVLLGGAYTLPMNYHFDSSSSPEFQGFFQPLYVPSRLELGVGWIPNRLIRGSAQVSIIGKTEGAALLSDNSRSVGSYTTLQPKVGAAYTFVDCQNFRGIVYGGSYYEVSRIEGASNRFHATSGIEFKAWVFTSGLGIDVASRYQNFSVSVGIDLGTVLEDLQLIPRATRRNFHGVLPSPVFISDDGLARPLVTHWQPKGPDMGLINIISNIPKNTEKEVQRIKKAINKIGKPSTSSDSGKPKIKDKVGE